MALETAAHQFALHHNGKAITSAIKASRRTPATALDAAATRDAIPPPDIFTTDDDDDDDGEKGHRLPSAAQCAVHLEFLETLFVLRQRVLRSDALDGAFDIKPEYKFVDRKGVRTQLKDETLWDRRQAKWPRFVELAVARFTAWWANARDTDTTMPPLDVLMVWHSFLLNPRYFRIHNRAKPFYRLNFPWADIHQAINSDNWEFSLPEAASTAFQEMTGLQPDLISSLSEWKTYPQETRSSLSGAARFSLQQAELVSAITDGIKTPDQRLLQWFADADAAVSEELKQAVLRQVSFVDKMDQRLWVRSPALGGTIRRARDRYNNFLRLYKFYSTTMFVPTLDIDLVWHTHQCSPSQYFTATQELAGKFVNHDDSIAKGTLDTALKQTRDLYRIRFAQEYLVCGCWDCEALLSALDSSDGDEGEPDLESIAKQVSSDVARYRKAEVARRAKESPREA
ncbi:hypothetical protein GP486_003310 [Trichoglossum hirsutum]|uniref:Glycine-rich domain-containing protein 1 n=1 Tax=Trichoglossum hirsutum TaxID=265104 RepID=A0A9P8LDG5_9PEZI|nr:hypothetical protein GP486_003310 [Trichoglossum hirsutum]